MKKFLLGMMISALPLAASAITIDVTQTACSGPASASDCANLTNQLKTELNKDLPEVSLDKYSDGVANSTAFAMKGQGSDYSDNFTHFVFKPSFGVAAQGDMNNPDKMEGVGVGGALTVGLNLDLLPVEKIGPVEFKKMDLFVSFMSYNMDQDSDDLNLKGDVNSFGIHARYRLIDPVDIAPGYLLEWGGVHLHTGFQFNKMGIDATQKIKDQTISSGAATAQVTNAFGQFTMDSKATTVPIEVSTYLRMLYAFTLYGGAGFDFVSASSDIDFKASANINGGATGYAATAAATESSDGKGKPTNFRGFVGFQVNVPFVRLFVHVNKGFGNDLVGANAGVKILY